VFLEHDEVLDSQDVLLVLDVFLLGLHEDVYLVQGQLHVLLLRTDYLDGNVLLCLVVEGFDDLAESAAAQGFE